MIDALAWVPPIRTAHLALVAASGTLFALRGLGVLAGRAWPMHPALRAGSVAIDTLLFAAGLALWTLLSLNPLREHWLASKLALLVVYVVLGTFALKRARGRAACAAFFAAALLVFATMVSIGWTRDALGMWRLGLEQDERPPPRADNRTRLTRRAPREAAGTMTLQCSRASRT